MDDKERKLVRARERAHALCTVARMSGALQDLDEAAIGNTVPENDAEYSADMDMAPSDMQAAFVALRTYGRLLRQSRVDARLDALCVKCECQVQLREILDVFEVHDHNRVIGAGLTPEIALTAAEARIGHERDMGQWMAEPTVSMPTEIMSQTTMPLPTAASPYARLRELFAMAGTDAAWSPAEVEMVCGAVVEVLDEIEALEARRQRVLVSRIFDLSEVLHQHDPRTRLRVAALHGVTDALGWPVGAWYANRYEYMARLGMDFGTELTTALRAAVEEFITREDLDNFEDFARDLGRLDFDAWMGVYRRTELHLRGWAEACRAYGLALNSNKT